MPWIDPVDDFARPPRPVAPASSSVWDGTLDPDAEQVRLDDVEISGTTLTATAQVVELVGVVATGATFETDDGGRIDIVNSTLTDCDLSRVAIGALRGSRLIGCKLAGSDLAERAIRDVVFERCSLPYTNLRRSKLERVHLTDCRLAECDLFEATLTDVVFDGSELTELANERTRCERVDLRGVITLGPTDPTNLSGCLIGDHHIIQLAHPLALRAGASIEREPDADPGD